MIAPTFAPATSADGAAPARQPLQRLTLNVADRCPLACRYCYAGGGVYDTAGSLMSPATALAAVTFVAHRYAGVAHINFFGGEPTLNPEVIALVCEYAAYLHAQGVLPALPTFGMTTSGYWPNGRIDELVRRYEISVTISVDGQPSVHDALRVTKRDRPTFERVAATVDRLREPSDRPPEIECTFTAEHMRQGLDLIDLLDFFHERFGVTVLHAPMVVTHPDSPWHVPLSRATILYPEAIRYSVDNVARGIGASLSVATRMLAALAGERSVGAYCPAAIETLDVDADGGIYACPMLVGGATRRLGNVHQPADGLRLPAELDRLISQSDTMRNDACRECWARTLCFGCIAEDVARGCPPDDRSAVPGRSPWCDFRRALVQALLTGVDAHLRVSGDSHRATGCGYRPGARPRASSTAETSGMRPASNARRDSS